MSIECRRRMLSALEQWARRQISFALPPLRPPPPRCSNALHLPAAPPRSNGTMSGRLLEIVRGRAAERAVGLQEAAELLSGLSEQERQYEFVHQVRGARISRCSGLSLGCCRPGSGVLPSPPPCRRPAIRPDASRLEVLRCQVGSRKLLPLLLSEFLCRTLTPMTHAAAPPCMPLLGLHGQRWLRCCSSAAARQMCAIAKGQHPWRQQQQRQPGQQTSICRM